MDDPRHAVLCHRAGDEPLLRDVADDERNIAEGLVREDLPQARRAGGEIERDAAVAALDEVLHDPRADAPLAARNEKGLLAHARQE